MDCNELNWSRRSTLVCYLTPCGAKRTCIDSMSNHIKCILVSLTARRNLFRECKWLSLIMVAWTYTGEVPTHWTLCEERTSHRHFRPIEMNSLNVVSISNDYCCVYDISKLNLMSIELIKIWSNRGDQTTRTCCIPLSATFRQMKFR